MPVLQRLVTARHNQVAVRQATRDLHKALERLQMTIGKGGSAGLDKLGLTADQLKASSEPLAMVGEAMADITG